MLASLRTIFGIKEPVNTPPAAMQREPDRPQYLPESRVPEGGIEGVANDGSVWAFWRVDPCTGENWFRRVSR